MGLQGTWSLVGFASVWALVAATLLWFGPSPTSWVTKGFLMVEVVAVAVALTAGIMAFPHVPVVVRSHAFPPWSHVVLAAVVASTMMDGWEVDSYAAEESRDPRYAPGIGGIIGAVIAFGVYLLLFPMLWREVPPGLLTGADPLTAWMSAVLHGPELWMAVAVLASTAGSLWLTTYILSRVVYALARDRVVPPGWGRLNVHGVPGRSIAAIVAAAWAVTVVELLVPGAVLGLQLAVGSAGFFLTAEFFLDNVTATRFLLTLHRRVLPHSWDRHHHVGMTLVSALTSGSLALILGAFLAVGGRQQDGITVLLLLAGGIWTWRRRADTGVFIFDGRETLISPPREGEP